MVHSLGARGLLLAAPLAFAASFCATAEAKDFHPGDLRVCNAIRCVPIVDRHVLRLLRSFYYGSERPPVADPARLGVRSFELRFRNGYVTGIVASAALDRFLSYGVNLGHFRRGT